MEDDLFLGKKIRKGEEGFIAEKYKGKPIFVEHITNRTRPIGAVNQLFQGDNGEIISEFWIDPNLPQGADIIAGIKNGIYKSLSVGIDFTNFKDERTAFWDPDPIELSVVHDGLFAGTKIISMYDPSEIPRLRYFEEGMLALIFGPPKDEIERKKIDYPKFDPNNPRHRYALKERKNRITQSYGIKIPSYFGYSKMSGQEALSASAADESNANKTIESLKASLSQKDIELKEKETEIEKMKKMVMELSKQEASNVNAKRQKLDNLSTELFNPEGFGKCFKDINPNLSDEEDIGFGVSVEQLRASIKTIATENISDPLEMINPARAEQIRRTSDMLTIAKNAIAKAMKYKEQNIKLTESLKLATATSSDNLSASAKHPISNQSSVSNPVTDEEDEFTRLCHILNGTSSNKGGVPSGSKSH